jgi:hypothetical protein
MDCSHSSHLSFFDVCLKIRFVIPFQLLTGNKKECDLSHMISNSRESKGTSFLLGLKYLPLQEDLHIAFDTSKTAYVEVMAQNPLSGSSCYSLSPSMYFRCEPHSLLFMTNFPQGLRFVETFSDSWIREQREVLGKDIKVEVLSPEGSTLHSSLFILLLLPCVSSEFLSLNDITDWILCQNSEWESGVAQEWQSKMKRKESVVLF